MRRGGVWVLLALVLWPVSGRADVTCDGIDDLLTTAVTAATFLTTTAYTMSAWVKSTGSTFTDDFCWSDGPAVTEVNENVALGRSGTTGTGNACAYHFDGISKKTSAALTAGWHHLAARFASGTLTLFVDGVVAGTVTAGAITDLSGAFRACGVADGQSPDRLAQVQVWNVALSDAQLETQGKSRLHYRSGTPPTGAWPLQDCGDGASGHGVAFRDVSGFGRTLTGAQGGNGAGLLCRASEFLALPWEVE